MSAQPQNEPKEEGQRAEASRDASPDPRQSAERRAASDACNVRVEREGIWCEALRLLDAL